MTKHLHLLAASPLFHSISSDELFSLLVCLNGTNRAYAKKETILAEGSEARFIGILLSGSAQIVQMDYMGNRSIMGVLGPGDLFGEAFACAGLASVPVSVAASEACEALLLDCGRILHGCSHACAFHQQLISNLVGILARKNILFHQKIEIISKRTTREKLMTYLLQQAKRAGSPSFDIPFNRQELADFLEVDRSGLSVQISRLAKEGVLTNRRNHFELSPEAVFHC